jgi:hypothetical protein
MAAMVANSASSVDAVGIGVGVLAGTEVAIGVGVMVGAVLGGSSGATASSPVGVTTITRVDTDVAWLMLTSYPDRTHAK